jgi:hypothetical protein
MNHRLTKEAVTFVRPFSVEAVVGTFPPGTYDIETTEEQLESISFVTYRRVRTTIKLPGSAAANISWQVYEMEPSDLATMKKRDAIPVSAGIQKRCAGPSSQEPN